MLYNSENTLSALRMRMYREMKNHSKSIIVIIMAFLMAISAPEAFAQGRITRKNPVNPYQQQVSKPSGYINSHGYVDLGLPSGLKWATCNVGASSPEDYGDYFAWGETNTKADYFYDNSLTLGKSLSELRSAGIINSSDVLNKSHDAARSNWGSTWRMPTKEEMEELNTECTWRWTTQGGKKGYKVTGPNGRSIFLPAAGNRYGSSLHNAGENGNYWSSSAYDDTYYAFYLYFYSGDHSVYWLGRGYGRSVRPVSE